MANRAKRTPEKDEQFFDAIVDAGGNITEACKATSYSRRSVYEYRASDPEFARRFDESTERGLDSLEDECRRRAFLGTNKPVFYQGEQCGTIREYSDVLAIFMLKAARPAMYRDRLGVDFDNASPEQVEKAILSMPDDKLRSLIARIRGQGGSGTAKPTG